MGDERKWVTNLIMNHVGWPTDGSVAECLVQKVHVCVSLSRLAMAMAMAMGVVAASVRRNRSLCGGLLLWIFSKVRGAHGLCCSG